MGRRKNFHTLLLCLCRLGIAIPVDLRKLLHKWVTHEWCPSCGMYFDFQSYEIPLSDVPSCAACGTIFSCGRNGCVAAKRAQKSWLFARVYRLCAAIVRQKEYVKTIDATGPCALPRGAHP